jgi:hypothetical protein
MCFSLLQPAELAGLQPDGGFGSTLFLTFSKLDRIDSRRSFPGFRRNRPMFSHLPCDQLHFPGKTSIHERKLAAWALFIGERRRVVTSPDRSTRPHRGMLPDIDPAGAAPEPNGRSILRRLIDFVRNIPGPVEALEIIPVWSLSGAREAPVGKTAALSYIGKEKPDRAGDRASATQANSRAT